MTGSDPSAIPLHAVELGAHTGAWFTGRPSAAPRPDVGAAGNLSHRRPHEPLRLARDRADVCRRIGLEVEDLHHMQQVHGAVVGTVTRETPRGAELRDVDGLVTTVPERALVVQVADCVPVLFASSEGPVAAVHAGRRGIHAGVIERCLERLEELGAPAVTLRCVVGPAIGGCCYEVPEELRDEVARLRPGARAQTTWGTPALDLPGTVRVTLEDAGVHDVASFGGCTRCDPGSRWFSHRADPDAGRQVGIVVRRDGV